MRAHLVGQRIRIFLLFEAVTFVAAALAHAGVLVNSYEHTRARNAESVIALVLLAGFMLSWIDQPPGIRPNGRGDFCLTATRRSQSPAGER